MKRAKWILLSSFLILVGINLTGCKMIGTISYAYEVSPEQKVCGTLKFEKGENLEEHSGVRR